MVQAAVSASGQQLKLRLRLAGRRTHPLQIRQYSNSRAMREVMMLGMMIQMKTTQTLTLQVSWHCSLNMSCHSFAPTCVWSCNRFCLLTASAASSKCD